jgi:hypothetical protein
MKKFTIFCLLLAFALPMPAVEDEQVMYLGGTAPNLRAGVVGQLDTRTPSAHARASDAHPFLSVRLHQQHDPPAPVGTLHPAPTCSKARPNPCCTPSRTFC